MAWMCAKIEVSEGQREVLEAIVRRRTSPQHLAMRARIILLADQGLSNRAISRLLGCERHQVGRWRCRWGGAAERLAAAEGEESSKAFASLIEETLSDAPRSGVPVKFTAKQVTQIVALACENPEDSRRPVTHWTPTELADEAMQRGIVDSISPRQVGRFLKSGRPQTASHPLLVKCRTG